jgi:hypothetical protein
MTELEVALVGSRNAWRHAEFPQDDEWQRPWESLRRVTIEVSERMTLGEVVDEALRLLGVAEAGETYRPSTVRFWKPEDDDGGIGRGTYLLPVMRPVGGAVFQPWGDVKIGQVFASAERGLIKGDPRRPYAFVLPQVGNGTLPGFAQLVNMLEVLKQVAEILALPGGVAATYYLARGRPDNAVQVVEARARDWTERGLDPYALDEWLDDHPWLPDEVAAALACTTYQAEAILWVLGFSRAASGLWRREESPEAATLAGIRRLLISTAAPDAADPRLASELRRRLEYLIEHDEAPPETDWVELPWLVPELPGTSSAQSRSQRAWKAMLHQLRKSAQRSD